MCNNSSTSCNIVYQLQLSVSVFIFISYIVSQLPFRVWSCFLNSLKLVDVCTDFGCGSSQESQLLACCVGQEVWIQSAPPKPMMVRLCFGLSIGWLLEVYVLATSGRVDKSNRTFKIPHFNLKWIRDHCHYCLVQGSIQYGRIIIVISRKQTKVS